MNVLLFLIFLAFLSLKIINASIIANWIHRISSVNKRILNFLIGYLVQTALFSFVLILSYFLAFNLQNLIFFLILLQILIFFIAIINFQYWWNFTKIQSSTLILFFVFLTISWVVTVLYLSFFDHVDPTLANSLNHYNNTTKVADVVKNDPFKSKQIAWWNVIFVALKEYFIQGLALNLLIHSDYLTISEFNLLFCLIFLYLVKSKWFAFNIKNYFLVMISFTLTWSWSLIAVLHYSNISWFLIYALVSLLVIYHRSYYQTNHHFLIFTFAAFSTFFYNYNSFFWVLVVGVNSTIYFLHIRDRNLLFYLLSNLLNIVIGLAILFFFNLEKNYVIFLTLVIFLMCLAIFAGLLIYFFHHRLLQNPLAALERFIANYMFRIMISISLIMFLIYVFYLSFDSYKSALNLIAPLMNFQNKKAIFNSLINISYFAAFVIITIYYLINKFYVKSLLRPIEHCNFVGIFVINNPLIYFVYLFLMDKINNNSNISSQININQYFPFIIFVLINGMMAFHDKWSERQHNHHQYERAQINSRMN